MDEDDDNVIMEVEEEVEVSVAIDSGCVVHTCGPKDLPTTVEVKHPPNEKVRNLVAANGSDMENYGKASVDMVQENGKVFVSTFTVTDVTRPLHSTSQVCDSTGRACPAGHGVFSPRRAPPWFRVEPCRSSSGASCMSPATRGEEGSTWRR